jgi:hypothetical protein
MEPLGREHTRATARKIREEHGIEMTPDEVIEHRKLAYAKIRVEMRAKGHVVPDDDTELFLWMQRLLGK